MNRKPMTKNRLFILFLLLVNILVACGPQRGRSGHQLQGQWKLVDTDGDGQLDTWVNEATGQSIPLCAGSESPSDGSCIPVGMVPGGTGGGVGGLSPEMLSRCLEDTLSNAEKDLCLMAAENMDPMGSGLKEKLALAFAENAGDILSGLAQLLIAIGAATGSREAEDIIRTTPSIVDLKYHCPGSKVAVRDPYILQGRYCHIQNCVLYEGDSFKDYENNNYGNYTLYQCDENLLAIGKVVTDLNKKKNKVVTSLVFEQIAISHYERNLITSYKYVKEKSKIWTRLATGL